MTEGEFREALKKRLPAVRFETRKRLKQIFPPGLKKTETRDSRILFDGASLPFATVYVLSLNHAPDAREEHFEKVRDHKKAKAWATALRAAAQALREVSPVEIPQSEPKGTDLAPLWHSPIRPSVRRRLPETVSDLDEIATDLEWISTATKRAPTGQRDERRRHFRGAWAELARKHGLVGKSLDVLGAAVLAVTFGRREDWQTFKRRRLE